MYCDPSSISSLEKTDPSLSSPQMMTDAQSRKQILDNYEKKGVDLPIVTLEMVLDRETSAHDDTTASNSNRAGDKKKNILLGRFPKEETPKSAPYMDALQQNQQESIKASFAERRNACCKGADDKTVVSREVNEATNNDVQQKNGSLGIFCCPQHHSTTENEKIMPTKDDAAANGTSVSTSDPESKRRDDPSVMFCCARNQTVDDDSQYIKSNLQLPEGCEDKDVARYRDIMKIGSLIDADESIVTSNADYEDEMTHTNREICKEDEHCWGSRRFRWTMMLCFLLHAVVISLIIVVAVNSRNRDSTVVVPNKATVSGSEISGVGCVDELQLSATCYGSTSNILVNFRSCVPQAGDWIAVYEATEDATSLVDTDSYSWMYTCGTRSCEQAVFSNIVHFRAATLLTTGTEATPMLKVHMMREGPGPTFAAIASSEVFRVVADVQSC
jgi:hypothetical protein